MGLTLNKEKKFSVGGIMCIIAALWLAGYSLISILISAIGVLTNFVNAISMAVQGVTDSYGTSLYFMTLLRSLLLNAVGSVNKLLLVISAIVLLALGILLIFKVNTRFIGLVAVPQIVIFTLMAFVAVGGDVLEVLSSFVFAMFNGRVALVEMSVYLVRNLTTLLPFIAFGVAWLVFGAVVLIFANNKKPINKAVAIVLSLVVALLFGAAPMATVINSVWNAFITVATYMLDGLSFDIMMRASGSSIVGTVFVLADSVVFSLIYMITFFLATNWLLNPYKTEKAVETIEMPYYEYNDADEASAQDIFMKAQENEEV